MHIQIRILSSIWFMCIWGALVIAFVATSTSASAQSPVRSGGLGSPTQMIDLVPYFIRQADCRDESLTLTLSTRNLLPDPVLITTTMHTSAGTDYIIPPFSGPDSVPYVIYCNGHNCNSIEFDLTVDYYNQVTETDETNNSQYVWAESYPTWCPPENTNTPTFTPTPTFASTGTPTFVPTSTPVTATPTYCAMSFDDVPPGSTFYQYVQCLYCRGIVSGLPDGTFGVNNPVTRGQLAKIVSNAAGFSDIGSDAQFEDVPAGSTFFDYVWRLADRAIVHGYDCGGPGEPCVAPLNLPYFRPNATATRGQLAKIDSTAAGYVDPPSGQTFEDVPPGSTFFDYIQRLLIREVMNGYPCGGAGEPCNPPTNLPYFRPSANATRGQTSKIVADTFYPDCPALNKK